MLSGVGHVTVSFGHAAVGLSFSFDCKTGHPKYMGLTGG
jgi:hypothetical protein